MKKEINIGQLVADSEAKQVSVYVLIKRQLNYRKTKPDKINIQCCDLCRAMHHVKYFNRESMQCAWIGILNDKNADIKSGHICNYFERDYMKKINDGGQND